jgi:capsular polysaccharide biosynthesis protein
MELKEYFQILKKELKTFMVIIVIVFLSAGAYFIFRPVIFDASLTLNITRSGTQNTDSYKYDDFYRMQADEKFAETIVEWLKSPRVEEDIYKDAGVNASDYSLKRLSTGIIAEQRSSQVVVANFSAFDQKKVQNIAYSVSKIISQNIKNLNNDQKENSWFEIISGDPVIRMREINPITIVAIFFGGIFLAFFGVLFKHYLQ